MEATKVHINRQMDKEDVVYMYTGILFIHKKNEILPFATAWIDLEGIMLNEISQRKTNTVDFHLCEIYKTKQMNIHKTEIEF